MPDADGYSEKPDNTSLARVATALEGIKTLLQAVAVAIVLLAATLGEVVAIVFAAVLLRGAAAWIGHLARWQNPAIYRRRSQRRAWPVVCSPFLKPGIMGAKTATRCRVV